MLGISREYARKLVCPPTTARSGEWYKKMRFPDPFHISPSGVRVWFVKDVHQWALTLQSKRTGVRKKKGIPILDAPWMLDELLGI